MAGFRPLLAATIENDGQLDSLAYPMIASPKVDGIRVLCHPEIGPCTRSLKPVRSAIARRRLSVSEFHWLDGEITCGPISAEDVFNRTTSGVMTGGSEEEFTYWVFDYFQNPEKPYKERWINNIYPGRMWNQFYNDYSYVRILPFRFVNSPADVLDAECDWLALGFEGLMLRHPLGKYKFNRSTLKEQILLKLKRWKDAEAVITGFEPLERNTNLQTRDNLGLAHRNDNKAGKVEVQVLGNLIVRAEGGAAGFGTFSVGSGFDASQRSEIWASRERHLGARIAFKYQEVGILNKPRFPIFKGFRSHE